MLNELDKQVREMYYRMLTDDMQHCVRMLKEYSEQIETSSLLMRDSDGPTELHRESEIQFHRALAMVNVFTERLEYTEAMLDRFDNDTDKVHMTNKEYGILSVFQEASNRARLHRKG